LKESRTIKAALIQNLEQLWGYQSQEFIAILQYVLRILPAESESMDLECDLRIHMF
jgi:hypothetical protein